MSQKTSSADLAPSAQNVGPTTGTPNALAPPLDAQGDAAAACHPTRAQMILIVSCACVLWAFGTAQICGLGFLLPMISVEMNSVAADTQWVVTGFNICWGSFALVSGRISDIYGLKRAMMGGSTVMGTFMLLSAFMPNVPALSIMRALAAVGHAMACPAMTGIIGRYIPEGRPRTLAFSFMAGSGAIGACLGWLSGGFLGEVKYNFRILSGVIGVTFTYPVLVGWMVVPQDTPHPTDKSIDWFDVPLLFALSVVFLALFIHRQWYLNTHPDGVPLIPKRLVFGKGKSKLLSLYISAVFVWVGVDSMAISGAFYYAEVLGVWTKQAALWILPCTVAGILGSIFVAVAVSRMPGGLLLALCDVINGVGSMLLALRSISSAYWHFDLWGWLTAGMATDGILALGNNLISCQTAPEDQGAATSFLLVAGRFGAALGLALTTMLRDSLARRHPAWESEEDGGRAEAHQAGLKGAFWLCAASLYFAGAVAFVGIGKWRAPNAKVDVPVSRGSGVEDGESNVVPSLMAAKTSEPVRTTGPDGKETTEK